MESVILELIPVAIALEEKIERGIQILRQQGELTAEGEAAYQAYQKKVFASRAAQVDPDPVG